MHPAVKPFNLAALWLGIVVGMNHWRIQNRILLLALLPSILVTIGLGAFFTYERWQDLDTLLDDRALSMAKHIAPTTEYGVMTGNQGILQNIANNMLEERDMRSISIYSQNMDVLAHAGPRMSSTKPVDHELQKDQFFISHSSQGVRIRAPIYAQNIVITDEITDSFYTQPKAPTKLLGWVDIELSNQNTRLAQYQHIISALFIIGAAGILTILLALRASRMLTTPIEQIILAVKEIENGKLDTRIHLKKGGELGQLASGVNAMASALQRINTEYQYSLEQATRDLHETLDEMEIRNRELQIGQKEAIEANRMKSEFLANVSHEIRTPLNGIIGFSELMARTQVNERQNDYLQTIRKSSTDLLKILNDILDLSKIDAGKLIFEMIDMNLRSVVDEVLNVLAPDASNKGIELNCLIYDDVPVHLRNDALRIKQVLTNLVSNAIKFTERGSVTLRVSLINKTNNHASLNFEIKDTGIGMTPEQIGKIFVPFSQADNSTTRLFGGTGLGLIISRALVEAMNGEIQVQSQPGQGSTFSFYMDSEVQETKDAEFKALNLNKLCFLDVNATSRLNTSILLGKWSVNTDSYEDIARLVEDVDTGVHEPWQAAILALGLKAPQAPEITELMIKMTQLNIPLIVLTNLIHTNFIDAFKQLGANCVFAQPYLHTKLYECLEKVVLEPTDAQPLLIEPVTRTQQLPHILAVDDNPANLKLITTLIRELQIPVHAAASGQEAIDIVQQQAIDLILMDIQMPGMNGMEATQRIRKLRGGENIPILALTAHAMADEKDALLKAGMNEYKTKPITLEQLIGSIEKWTGYLASPLVVEPPKPSFNIAAAHDLTIFSTPQALKNSNHNVQLAIDMFQMLLEPLGSEAEQIMQAWEDENFEKLLDVVHKMHGATRYCGVPKLQESLGSLETALKNSQSNLLPELVRVALEQINHLQHWASSNDWRLLLQQGKGEN